MRSKMTLAAIVEAEEYSHANGCSHCKMQMGGGQSVGF
jgi:hypothetical protein